MADFIKAFNKVMAFEGDYSKVHFDSNKQNINIPLETILCSDCFKNHGLKLSASKIGIEVNEVCPNCQSKTGRKLNTQLIYNLSYSFFVRGAFIKLEYGGSPSIQFNERIDKEYAVNFPPDLKADVDLISKATNIVFFPYGPPLWLVGEIEPLISLQKFELRDPIIQRIINEYPTVTLSKENIFYRIRTNLQEPENLLNYDSPPQGGKGRLDSVELPILYCAPSIETCVHECRVTIEDELFLATLSPERELKLLDLTEIINDKTTPFESLDLAIHFLFLAGIYSYEISRAISIAVNKKGFDGIIFPSYFSLRQTGAIPFETAYGLPVRILIPDKAKKQIVGNIGIFGNPIKDGKVGIKCLNKLLLKKVDYDLIFGPILHM